MVLICNVPALILIVSAAVAVCTEGDESLTWTLKEYRPVAVGVPDTTPVLAFRERPGGSNPEARLQL